MCCLYCYSYCAHHVLLPPHGHSQSPMCTTISTTLTMYCNHHYHQHPPTTSTTHTLAKKNETTMSQITSLLNAENAAGNDNVLVATAVVADKNAQAPTGSGESTRPAMVDTKIASSVQASVVIPTGQGTTKRSTAPIAMEAMRGTGLAPWVGVDGRRMGRMWNARNGFGCVRCEYARVCEGVGY